MLLRSYSSPIASSPSWLLHMMDSSPEPEFLVQKIPMLTRSFSSISISSSSSSIYAMKESSRSFSEIDMHDGIVSTINTTLAYEDEEEQEVSGCKIGVAEMVEGGGGRGGSSRKCGGGKDGESNNGSGNKMDVYYRTLIEANPGNIMILSNYARFLKEIKGDFVKAEEYCGRAILANKTVDGSIMSLYADLIWEIYQDGERAQCYYNQATKAAPDDCDVWASYARFLWDSDHEFEGQECQCFGVACVVR